MAGWRRLGWQRIRWHRVGAADSATPGTSDILVDAADTTPGFLTGKLGVTAPLTKSILNPGGNEVLQLAIAPATDATAGSLSAADHEKLADLPDEGIHVTAPISGDGSAGSPLAISAATDAVDGYMTAVDHEKLSDLPDEGIHVTAPLTGDGAVGSELAISAATQAAAGSMSLADKKKLDVLIADWALGAIRFYAIDFVGGNDANAGFSDVSMTAAFTVAKKTWAGFLAVFPRLGQGRLVTIALKANTAGATYGESFLLDGVDGYQDVVITASTDGSGNALDQTMCGFVTADTGPGVGGVWAAAAGATVSAITVAAGALAATPADWGKRVLFTGNITAGLANQSRYIQQTNSGTGVVTLLQDSTLAAAAGDTFTIQQPGVLFDHVILANVRARRTLSIRGIASVNEFTISDCYSLNSIAPVFCEARAGAFTLQGLDTVNMSSVRAASFVATNLRQLLAGVVVTVGATTYRAVRECTQNGMVFRGTVTMNDVGGPGVSTIVGVVLGRNNGGFRDALFDGAALVLVGGGGFLQNAVFQNLGAVDCVQTQGDGTLWSFNAVTGGTGNTAFGFNSTSATNSQFHFTACTVTGTSGDFSAGPNAVPCSWADLTKTNIPDDGGNDHIGSAGKVVPVGASIRVTNKSGGALAVGEAVRGNGTTGQVTGSSGNDATPANSNVLGIVLNTSANNAGVLIVGGGYVYGLFDGAPTPGAIAYLSPGTARALTTTVPAVAANNNKLRVGRVATASGSTGRLRLAPEYLAVVADGAV